MIEWIKDLFATPLIHFYKIVDAVENIGHLLQSVRDGQTILRHDLAQYAKARACVTYVLVGSTVLAENEYSQSNAELAGHGVRITIHYRLVDGTTETVHVDPQRPVRVHYDGRVWFEVVR